MRSHRLIVLAGFLTLAFALPGCEDETDVTTPPVDDDATTTTTRDITTDNEYSSANARQIEEEEDQELTTSPDADILGSLIAIDDNEIAATTEAKSRDLSEPVMSFANMLFEAHSRHKAETEALAGELGMAPTDDILAQEIRSKGAQALADIRSLTGEDFERAFVDAMVQGHSDALNTIDEAMQNVVNDELRQHLTDTRASVADHLRQGQALQSQLGG